MSTPIVPFYDSDGRQWRFIDEIGELFRFREFLRLLIFNAVTTRYKRSVLGFLWTLLNPLITMGILAFVFSELFRNSLVHYPVYLLTGILFWQFFSQTTVQSMNVLVWGGGLLKRAYIPRSVFIVAAVGSGLVNLFISFLPLILIVWIVGHPFYLTWWFLPVATILLTMFTLGASLFLAALAVQFTDVIDMYQMIVQALFWFTPIMYPKSVLPDQMAWVINLNPLYHLLELFRVPLYYGWLPGPNTMVAGIGMSCLSLLIGGWFFMWRADRIVYHI
jgi:ABC-type polysaccharide/polyol phosphate export permease